MVEDAIGAVARRLGEAELGARVSRIYRTGACGADEALCALAECDGATMGAIAKARRSAIGLSARAQPARPRAERRREERRHRTCEATGSDRRSNTP